MYENINDYDLLDKVSDNEECKKYVKQFETFTPLDVKVCQFVWYVENSEL